MSQAAAPSRLKADLALIFIALIWGATFILVKEALDDVSTMLFLTLRFALATVALAILYRGRGAHYPRNVKRDLAIGVLVGTFLFGGYVLQTAGLRYTTASKAGFITGFYIALVPVLNAVVYRRIPQISEVSGRGVCHHRHGADDPEHASAWRWAGAICWCSDAAVAYAFHIVLLGHFSRHMSYEHLTLYQIGTGAMLGALTFWWTEPPRVAWLPALWSRWRSPACWPRRWRFRCKPGRSDSPRPRGRR